ncbi:MAG: hypothetical protein HQL91_11925 [Magnetococcales bacterium]|nr:hypothetical protein [Magnetococcales bacterium]
MEVLMPWPDRLILWIPLLPWVAALWIGVGMLRPGGRGGEAGERGTARAALWAVGIALLGLLWLDGRAWWQGVPGPLVFGNWLASGTVRVSLSLLLDRPALVMATVVALACLVTLRFSVDYMHREPGFHRFFAVLCLFAGGMLWIALAGNALLTFVGWEVAGLSSYLLISYARERATAAENATRAFVTNRFGDAGLLFGIAMAFGAAGTIEWPAVFEASHRASSPPVPIVLAGFLLAALAKSAQIPFFPWIARALEGPTPSSAIFYGALMAHAGAFLVIRLEPLLWHSPFLMGVLLVIGLLTALLASAIGRVQSDVKSALIFSTQAQLGLIFFECGAGLFDFALFHLVAHTLWRLHQFLLAPSYLQLGGLRGARPVPGWLARSRTLYDLLLHRGWFDALTDALITRPTLALAKDARIFEEVVVNRMAGRTLRETLLASRAEWDDPDALVQDSGGIVTEGRGLFGRLLEGVAKVLFWFEESLVLNSSGDGLLKAVAFLGDYLTRIEASLGQPRYLVLLIALTFLVIL